MTITNLTPSQLRKAADLKERIEKLQRELSTLQNGEAEVEAKPGKARARKFSAAGIAKIRAAQKARWAKIHAENPEKPEKPAKAVKAAKPGKRGPRKMSPEARAKIAAAQKARWAKVHAAKK
jgi:hypothetical protein